MLFRRNLPDPDYLLPSRLPAFGKGRAPPPNDPQMDDRLAQQEAQAQMDPFPYNAGQFQQISQGQAAVEPETPPEPKPFWVDEIIRLLTSIDKRMLDLLRAVSHNKYGD